MVSKWSAERVWESIYDLRSEATVQVKKQQNMQLYSAAHPTGAKNKKQSRGSYPSIRPSSIQIKSACAHLNTLFATWRILSGAVQHAETHSRAQRS